VNDLVVTSFQFAVNVYILDVQTGKMLENFLLWPYFNILYKGPES